MFKETKTGQTYFCQACEYEARPQQWGSTVIPPHTCGKHYQSIIEHTQAPAQGWEEEFDNKKLGCCFNYSCRFNTSDNHNQKLKDFISSQIAQAEKRAAERERRRVAVELEKFVDQEAMNQFIKSLKEQI